MKNLENLYPDDLQAIAENQLDGEVCVDFLTKPWEQRCTTSFLSIWKIQNTDGHQLMIADQEWHISFTARRIKTVLKNQKMTHSHQAS